MFILTLFALSNGYPVYEPVTFTSDIKGRKQGIQNNHKLRKILVTKQKSNKSFTLNHLYELDEISYETETKNL